MRRRRLPAWETADAAAVSLALGYGVGRVGCFLVGDDYGVPTDLPWGVRFPVGLPPTQAGWLRSEFGVQIPEEIPDHALLAVHPTQLYETLLALGICLFGRWLLVRQRRVGTTAVAVLALLSVERFAIEFLRAKDDRFLGPFTVAQLLSVALFAAMAILAARRFSTGGDDESPAARPG
jgi:phosphatidylglycerol:prolipoprotein diacylglycerol transferase